MQVIVFEIESNDEIFNLIDKRYEHIFIHKLNSHSTIEWINIDLKVKNLDIKDISVRNMEFDMQTDFNGLKKIINLNTNQLMIYQFDKPVPDTLILEHLPEKSKEKILFQNGLKHFFFIDFEFITIESDDKEFIDLIKNNPLFSKRIIEREGKLRQNTDE